MRHYLDQYLKMAAENFEKELARVSTFDEHAKEILEDSALQTLLKQIKSGEIVPPSDAFGRVEMWFQTDAKFCNQWASDLFYKRKEEKLFNAVADLSNLLGYYENDSQFADYCKRAAIVFPDGWPNDPVLFEKTLKAQEEELAAKQAVQSIPKIQRLKEWVSKNISRFHQ